ncbi:MAG: dihydroorotate dehydrogenase electron transfer subunit [Pseudodesulfovibrio sp.]|uniref:Dihydroorotate dehydrogenase, electron transfer subunit, iron-sulfur cluster binding domain protein n=1 Tax=Pseudodesulfovibrio aespoeensis (strain ATCC 700646 / DSM 10631 / Aspo-2) TaxID=643562 RepID=E6VU32_PSEA9|nr:MULTISPECIES: dihydroorotate dehydrogenase [Pseudodesulfovibrio]ADU62225.1 Dihydroorotate dehydrogenase, electron transfer subunit, iron-sulfur cluster binding domain protein [Pseudodesulfovibrio aespoeensis Aspo-2]MBU4192585.1 dihydroorotate dehydrogenase electron transfer subunit [Pseudomonadota bacterium]MBU4243070.1 dihydroorotate dehydrogenase electron transfer subunit [Pseudomonadota bacterium]MBU4379014.1 dihydroorotate dehydrogenase electron transfer subunit [Pseudomonadota bacterium
MSLRICRNVTVLEVSPVGQSKRPDEFYEIRLSLPDWDGWKPGQFVMVRPVSWELDLLWARPFSISSVDNESVTIFIQKVGRGTARMARLAPGDQVALWGPLGNSFAMEPDTPTLLLAGGIGIAPFRGYVEHHPHPENLRLFLAHRLPVECYPFGLLSARVDSRCMLEAQPCDLDLIIAAMRAQIAEYAALGGLVLACGPTPFMRTVQTFAAEFGARAQVSLENRMACGVGACLGCVTRDGEGHHVQVCTRGPIFWSDKVQL